MSNTLKPLSLPAFDKAQLRDYAAISGDDNPIHYEDEVAKKAGFPGILVHGMLSMAAMGNFLEAHFPSREFQTLKFQVRFRKIVYPGDTLECSSTEKPSAESGTTLLGLSLKNAKGELVCEGNATLRPL